MTTPLEKLEASACWTEAKASAALASALRNAGWFVCRLESGYTKRGIPDLFLAPPVGRRTAHPLFVELKAGNNKPTANQVNFLNQVNRRSSDNQAVWIQAKSADSWTVFTITSGVQTNLGAYTLSSLVEFLQEYVQT